MKQKEYTFTCIECGKTYPVSKGSVTYKYTCKDCALKMIEVEEDEK